MRMEDAKPSFSVHYDEGLKVGYKWYDAEKKPVLFPFGFGLSYTTFAYSDLQVNARLVDLGNLHVTNTGSREGKRLPKSMQRCQQLRRSLRSGW
jgi:beta-glucosidase